MKNITPDISWFLGQGYDSNAFVIESEGSSLLIDSGLGDKMPTGFGSNTRSLSQIQDAVKTKNISEKRFFH